MVLGLCDCVGWVGEAFWEGLCVSDFPSLEEVEVLFGLGSEWVGYLN
jgi:hypothetical protein